MNYINFCKCLLTLFSYSFYEKREERDLVQSKMLWLGLVSLNLARGVSNFNLDSSFYFFINNIRS